jgi:AcrR family transcriptional regulator
MPKISDQKRFAIRGKILQTAVQILETDGIQALTMRDLAGRLDYTATALYQYFPGKDALLHAMREEGWRQWMDSQRQAWEKQTTPASVLRSMARAYIAFALTHPAYYRLMMDMPDAAVGGPAVIAEDPRFAPLVRAVEAGYTASSLRLPPGYTASALAFHLWISLHGYVMLRYTLMQPYAAEFDQLYEGIIHATMESLTGSKEASA